MLKHSLAAELIVVKAVPKSIVLDDDAVILVAVLEITGLLGFVGLRESQWLQIKAWAAADVKKCKSAQVAWQEAKALHSAAASPIKVPRVGPVRQLFAWARFVENEWTTLQRCQRVAGLSFLLHRALCVDAWDHSILRMDLLLHLCSYYVLPDSTSRCLPLAKVGEFGRAVGVSRHLSFLAPPPPAINPIMPWFLEDGTGAIHTLPAGGVLGHNEDCPFVPTGTLRASRVSLQERNEQTGLSVFFDTDETNAVNRWGKTRSKNVNTKVWAVKLYVPCMTRIDEFEDVRACKPLLSSATS